MSRGWREVWGVWRRNGASREGDLYWVSRSHEPALRWRGNSVGLYQRAEQLASSHGTGRLDDGVAGSLFKTAGTPLSAHNREPSDHDPLDLIETDLIASPIVELRRARRGMVSHCSGFLQCSAVLEISCDPSGGAASSCVDASIQVETCSGCTSVIDGTPASAHQAARSGAWTSTART